MRIKYLSLLNNLNVLLKLLKPNRKTLAELRFTSSSWQLSFSRMNKIWLNLTNPSNSMKLKSNNAFSSMNKEDSNMNRPFNNWICKTMNSRRDYQSWIKWIQESHSTRIRLSLWIRNFKEWMETWRVKLRKEINKKMWSETWHEKMKNWKETLLRSSKLSLKDTKSRQLETFVPLNKQLTLFKKRTNSSKKYSMNTNKTWITKTLNSKSWLQTSEPWQRRIIYLKTRLEKLK